MKEMQIFINDEFGDIRTAEINGKPYFMGSDIAKALGYAKPNDAVKYHCRATVKHSIPIGGKQQECNFIGEGDVYRLVVRSKLPSAEKFESWVFDEILPELRSTGTYIAKGKQTESIPIGEVASLSKVMDRIMVRQESKPYEIAGAFKLLCNQFGIILPADFVKVPEYEQIELPLKSLD